ncbi:MAG: hypothetical protein ROW48_13835 [Bellilinea sp.]|jgi:hypothetical protein
MVDETTTGIHIPLEELLRRLKTLNGFIHLLANQLGIFQQTFKKSFEDQDINSSLVYAGYTLIIPDLTSPDNQRFLPYVHGGAYVKEGEEYFKAGEELVNNWSTWTIAHSYEAFETFLRDTTACYFFTQKPQKPIGSLQHIPIEAENVDAWKNFFRERKWDPSTILKLLRQIEPEIEESEKRNYLQIDIQQWFLIYTYVRHAVTHSNSRLMRQNIKASAASIDIILPTFFPGSWVEDTYYINCSKESAIKIIELIGAYAFLIYRKLCYKIR